MTVGDVDDLVSGFPAATQFGCVEFDFARFALPYQCAISTLTSKASILGREFVQRDGRCPIERVSSRVKTLDSIVAKARRLRCPISADGIRRNIFDIAGVRITCGLMSDVYRVAALFSQQPDVTLIEVEDYVATPKANGYRSLHLAVEIPVFVSNRVRRVPVELQIRTTAMDMWASLEHDIHYKHPHATPTHLLNELTHAADAAHRLDTTMQRLHDQVGRSAAASHSNDVELSRFNRPSQVGGNTCPHQLCTAMRHWHAPESPEVCGFG
jgi:putative GTP pyrophosphokinase